MLKNENATDEEKIGEILDLLHGETDTLKAQIDEAKNSDTSKAKEWEDKAKEWEGKYSTLLNTQHFRTIRRSRKRHRRQQRKKTRTRNC